MRKLILGLLILIIPAGVFATHIVGGSLTYEHLGGSSYRITLKLYRDDGGQPAVGVVGTRGPGEAWSSAGGRAVDAGAGAAVAW